MSPEPNSIMFVVTVKTLVDHGIMFHTGELWLASRQRADHMRLANLYRDEYKGNPLYIVEGTIGTDSQEESVVITINEADLNLHTLIWVPDGPNIGSWGVGESPSIIETLDEEQ